MQYNWKRNTAVFLSSQAISIFGSTLVQYAITWHITLTTKSGVFATLAIVCAALPTFLLSPFAGVWADRYDRKKLIMFADGFIALATLVLALLFMAGHQEIWLLLIVLVIRALGSAVQSPCVSAVLPDMVPSEHLTRVNGINSSLQSLITLISPLLSAALLGFAPLYAIFFIDVVTAAAAILVMLTFFKLPSGRRSGVVGTGSYFSELKLGISYIVKTPFLRTLFILLAIFCVLSAPVAFLPPLQVARSFGDEVWRLSGIEVAFSLGMVIGGLAISAWGGFKNRIHTMLLAGLVMAVGVVALGLPIPFTIYLAVMGIIGLAMPTFNTPAMVMLQQRVHPDYVGRIFSVITMINTGMMPLGMVLFGPLADIIPIETLLVITGIMLAVLVSTLLFSKSLLAAGAPQPQTAEVESERKSA